MADEKYNTRNPAVKRILQEVREMQNNEGDEFKSLPVQDNIFEWQFAIRGPQETEFEGGIYHGRIQLPPEYPFRPPAFVLLTPNGRFETHTKICLSISQHHPEHWQPSWSVRTALVALIAFLPTKPDGALGSLDYTMEERRGLAIKSRAHGPKFGNPDRQQLIDEIHESMLKDAPPVPNLEGESAPSAPSVPSVPSIPPTPQVFETEARVDNSESTESRVETVPALLEDIARELHAVASVDASAASSTPPAPAREESSVPAAVGNRGFIARLQLADDLGLTLLAIGLTIAIIAICMKKVLTIYFIPTINES